MAPGAAKASKAEGIPGAGSFMRWLDNISDWFALRRHMEGAWTFIHSRRRRPADASIEVRLRDGSSLRLRAHTEDRKVFLDVFVRDVYGIGAFTPGSLGTVLDIGGHVGTFAARVAPLASRVISYEPTPDSFRLLEENVRQFRNVRITQAAVAGRAGPVTLRLRADPGGNAIVATDEPEEPIEILEVQGTTLEGIFTAHGIDHCSLLKMDCEGAEYEIVYGAPSGLWSRVDHIAMEYHPLREAPAECSGQALARFLQSLGHRVTLNPRSRHPGKGMLFSTRT